LEDKESRSMSLINRENRAIGEQYTVLQDKNKSFYFTMFVFIISIPYIWGVVTKGQGEIMSTNIGNH